MNHRPVVIQNAIDAAGGLVALAVALQLAPSTVSEWRRVPAERVIAVERITGVPRTELRPDLYPEEGT